MRRGEKGLTMPTPTAHSTPASQSELHHQQQHHHHLHRPQSVPIASPPPPEAAVPTAPRRDMGIMGGPAPRDGPMLRPGATLDPEGRTVMAGAPGPALRRSRSGLIRQSLRHWQPEGMARDEQKGFEDVAVFCQVPQTQTRTHAHRGAHTYARKR